MVVSVGRPGAPHSVRGLIAVLLSGISGGAFPLPGKKIPEWKWEHVWAVYSLVAMCLLPFFLTFALAPGTVSRLATEDRTLSLRVAAFGMLFGVGSVLFGISLARLGMAITNALVSGIIVFLGSLAPLLVGSVRLDSKHLAILIIGLLMLVASLVLCAGAAISRDRVRRLAASELGSRSVVAVSLAVLAGCFSAMLNVGFALGAPLATNAMAAGCLPIMATLAIWVPALFGGAILNVGYPLYLIGKQSTWLLFISGPHAARSWLMASLMALLWFGNILLYGYGASIMTAGAVYGWALSSAASILTSNALGAFSGEWQGAGPKAKRMMAFSTVLLICSFALLASQSLTT